MGSGHGTARKVVESEVKEVVHIQEEVVECWEEVGDMNFVA